jgi:hypothetical protein
VHKNADNINKAANKSARPLIKTTAGIFIGWMQNKKLLIAAINRLLKTK